jgi:ubiquinone/menaquinone biosynthesis C-methylase UbiE
LERRERGRNPLKDSSQGKTTTESLSTIKSTYDALTEVYDELYGYEQTLKHLELLRKVDFSNKRMLDAGAGTLLFEKLVLSLKKSDNYWIVALDISKLIKKPYQETKLSEKIDAVIGDITSIPFREDSFNIVLSITVLGGLGELLRKATTNLYNVCKKGGKIIITMHQKTVSKAEQDFLNDSCMELWRAGADICCGIEKPGPIQYK